MRDYTDISFDRYRIQDECDYKITFLPAGQTQNIGNDIPRQTMYDILIQSLPFSEADLCNVDNRIIVIQQDFFDFHLRRIDEREHIIGIVKNNASGRYLRERMNVSADFVYDFGIVPATGGFDEKLVADLQEFQYRFDIDEIMLNEWGQGVNVLKFKMVYGIEPEFVRPEVSTETSVGEEGQFISTDEVLTVQQTETVQRINLEFVEPTDTIEFTDVNSLLNFIAANFSAMYLIKTMNREVAECTQS